MSFRLLGPLEVGDGRPIRGARERKLLALLLLHAPAAVSGHAAAEWTLGADHLGDESSLYVAVSRLRRQLRDAGVDASIERSTAGLRLRVDVAGVDSGRFVQLMGHARASCSGADRLAILREGLALWRGDVLAGEDLPPCPAIIELNELRLAAIEERFTLELDLDDDPRLLGELLSWCERAPNRERLWALAMTGLYRHGRHVEALALFQQARQALLEGLGLDPSPQLVELEARILRHDPTLLRSPGGGSSLLPSGVSGVDRAERRTDQRLVGGPTTPASHRVLFGRERELDSLAALLDHNRLVTIVGTGGVGKTRLALRVGGDLRHRYRHGVHVVDLAAVSDPQLVATAIVEALELPRSGAGSALDTLLTHLAERHCLLVLDNCEHVIEQTAVITRALLAASTSLTVLATSRQPLHLDGEQVVPLAPLAVRADSDDGGPAVALFVHRAALGGYPVAADARSRSTIAAICTRLDGLPLAIELAAARVRSMSLTEIHERLDSRFRLLTGGPRDPLGRQRTLEATTAWSYQHLEPAVRSLFDHISVFVGGFGLDAAVSMVDEDELVVLDGLDQLVDRSLLVAEGAPDAPTRYTMLESLHRYGIDRLVERGSIEDVRDRHLGWLRDLTSHASPQLQLSVPDALRRIDRELANVRAGLDWATHDAERAAIGVDIVLALGRYWYQRGITAEAARWIERLRAAQPPLSRTTEAEVLCDLGFSLLQAGDAAAALEPLDASPTLAREVGDDALLCRVLHYLTRAGLGLRDPDELLALIDEGRALARRLHDRLYGYLHSIIRVIWFIFHGDAARAQQVGAEFVAEHLHDPSPHIGAHVHETGAWLALLAGDASGARDHLASALAIYGELANPGCSCHALETFAWWHAVRGDNERALLVLDAVLTIRARDRHHRARYESVPHDGVTRLLGDPELPPSQHRLFDELAVGIEVALDAMAAEPGAN